MGVLHEINLLCLKLRSLISRVLTVMVVKTCLIYYYKKLGVERGMAYELCLHLLLSILMRFFILRIYLNFLYVYATY